MDARKTKRLSHAMSAVLRHRAGQLGLPMDAAGWMDVTALCAHLRISRSAVEHVVAHNNKSRFELAGARIRASQGHSLDGMPVTQDALEASWSRHDADGSIWHGTRIDVVESIAARGILRGGRTHVHLAASPDSQVGKRANVALLLGVCPRRLARAGFPVFRSGNGVLLARHVPAPCVVDVRTLSRGSHPQIGALRAAFGLG